ncbi:hypothetical protein NUACC21_78100 [Scytonema sp. NUACC21]
MTHVQKIDNKNNTQELVQQGKELYNSGEFSLAVEVLQKAAAAFNANGNILWEALTLSNLSLAYQQLSLWNQAEKAIGKAIALLYDQSLNSSLDLHNSQKRSLILAQALDVQGQLQLAQGKTDITLESWEKAADIYRKIGETTALIRNRINSAQALQALGNYRQANKILTGVSQALENQPDSPVKIAGLLSLGNVLQVVGDLKESQQVLEKSLALAKASQSNQDTSEILLSLGNTARAQKEFEKALELYQQSASLSSESITRIQAYLNQLNLLLKTKRFSDALVLSSQIQSEIGKMEPNRMAVETKINFAQNLIKLSSSSSSSLLQTAAQILADAVQEAQSLQDRRVESYALGTFGELYEQNQQFAEAQKLTEKALFIAQNINAADIAYQWQWQMGRLRKQQGDIKGATAFYSLAFKTLQSLRRDLVTINPDIQFYFRDSVEPVYREFVALLLETGDGKKGRGDRVEFPRPQSSISQENLRQARFVIESLQLAELDNFFRSACLEPTQELDPVVDKEDQQAAVLYPIILPDRLDVILKLPNLELRHYSTSMTQNKVKSIVEELRKNLRDVTETVRVKQLSQQLYDWLIRPAEAALSESGIKTLVFVLDGELRNVPMAVLYDRQQKKYLVEKYAVALTPGLQLLKPTPLQKVKLNALTAGVTQSRSIANRTFPKLQNVPRELKEIQSEIPKSEELLDGKFTETNLHNQLQSDPYTVIHLATHGQFSSDPEKTFILTWDKLLQVKEFDRLLRLSDRTQPSTIELLVLSACKTAEGDKQAALGLAGVAVRAGVRSTLATLWSVDDESTANLMSEFYRELKIGVNKAEALQHAQLAVMAKDNNPFFWAPFVLLGNWL